MDKPTTPDPSEPRDKNTRKFLDEKATVRSNEPADTDRINQTTTDKAQDTTTPVTKEPAKTATAERNPAVPETKEEVNPQGAEHTLDAHTGENRDFKGSAAMDVVKPY